MMLVEDYRFNTVAIWAGVCDIEAEPKYLTASRGRKAGFEKDLGQKIDLDWFYSQATENNVILPTEQLIETFDFWVKDKALLLKTALEKDVSKGNRAYFYDCAKFKEKDSAKTYCGLKFIGNFERLK